MANDHSTGNPRPAKPPPERRLTVGTQYYEYPADVPEQRRSRRVSRITLKAPPMFGLMAPPEPAIFALQTG